MAVSQWTMSCCRSQRTPGTRDPPTIRMWSDDREKDLTGRVGKQREGERSPRCTHSRSVRTRFHISHNRLADRGTDGTQFSSRANRLPYLSEATPETGQPISPAPFVWNLPFCCSFASSRSVHLALITDSIFHGNPFVPYLMAKRDTMETGVRNVLRYSCFFTNDWRLWAESQWR